MHIRTGTGHYVEADCSTLCLLGSTREPIVMHLLRLWPSRNGDPVPQPPCGDQHTSGRAIPSLTPREKEVFALLAAGRSTRDMAEVLRVSPATVRTHVEHILRKLRAHSRLEAVVAGAREGLL
jgi:DNA-binding CsgD family transcriptional regulator